jgi:hypothetical protein
MRWQALLSRADSVSNPEPFDRTDDLAVDIPIAIQLGPGNKEIGLVPFLPEIPFKLGKRDGLLEREASAAHGDRVKARRARHFGARYCR